MNASARSGLWPFLMAEPRTSADQYAIVLSFAVAGRSSPVERIGAAAPIARARAMYMCCVATTMSAPADPAFVLISVYVGILIWLRALTVSVAISRRPPYVFMSKTMAEA